MGLKKDPQSVPIILDNYKLCQTHQAGNCPTPFHTRVTFSKFLICFFPPIPHPTFLNFIELSPHSTERNLIQKHLYIVLFHNLLNSNSCLKEKILPLFYQNTISPLVLFTFESMLNTSSLISFIFIK